MKWNLKALSSPVLKPNPLVICLMSLSSSRQSRIDLRNRFSMGIFIFHISLLCFHLSMSTQVHMRALNDQPILTPHHFNACIWLYPKSMTSQLHMNKQTGGKWKVYEKAKRSKLQGQTFHRDSKRKTGGRSRSPHVTPLQSCDHGPGTVV